MNFNLKEFNAICHTTNCENAEIVFVVNVLEAEPNAICGVCGNQITDLEPK